MQPTKLLRRLSKSEYRRWRQIERQLQKEGLGTIGANIDATGSSFPQFSNGYGAVVSYSPDRYDSDGGHVLGLDVDATAARRTFGGLGTIADTDTACAVDRLRGAFLRLPVRYSWKAFLDEWTQSGNARAASRHAGLSQQKGLRVIRKFLRDAGLPFPWPKRSGQQMADLDPDLCHDKSCPKRLGKHSKHGKVKRLSKRLSGYPSQRRAIPPKQDRAQYLRDNERLLQELKNG